MVLQPGGFRRVLAPAVFVFFHRPPKQPAGGAPAIDEVAFAEGLPTSGYDDAIVFEARARMRRAPVEHERFQPEFL